LAVDIEQINESSDEDWDNELESPWSFSGYSEYIKGKFKYDNVTNHYGPINELRLQGAASYNHEKFEFKSRGDIIFDEVLSETIWQTREFNIALSPLENIDLKLGRQVLTWGTGNYVFLNDLFPKDWQSFFSGRNFEYFKSPSDTARLTSYLGDITLDLAWTPEFTADNFIKGDRFSFFSPDIWGHIAPGKDFKVTLPDNDQWFARISTTVNNVEYALYGYRGNWPTPVGVDNIGEAYFPKMNSWGASLQTAFKGGIFNAEYSYYDSQPYPVSPERFNTGLPVKDLIKYLIGYETEIAKNLNLGIQCLIERIPDFWIPQRKYPALYRQTSRKHITYIINLSYRALRQKLIPSILIFHSPNDNDYYIKPSIDYRINDKWLLSTGANIFTGDNVDTFYSQHKPNSNIWMRFRYRY